MVGDDIMVTPNLYPDVIYITPFFTKDNWYVFIYNI